MKVDLDARTLEAMRVLLKSLAETRSLKAVFFKDINEAYDVVESFLAQHDPARDAEGDEALAKVIHDAHLTVFVGSSQWECVSDTLRRSRVAQARAARDFIAKEQGQ